MYHGFRHALIGFAISTCVAAAQPVLFQGLGDLPGDPFGSNAKGVSGDGRLVAGNSNTYPSPTGRQAFLWSATDGMINLGSIPGGLSAESRANAVSRTGVAVGAGSSPLGWEAFRWTDRDGMVGLGDLPGGEGVSEAYDVSDDGRVVVGYSQSEASAPGFEAFIWTPEQGMVGLGFLPGGNISRSEARAVSSDGTIVAGTSSTTGPGAPRAGFRWTEVGGLVELADLPGGATRTDVYGMSKNGQFVVGACINEDRYREAVLWNAEGEITPLGFVYEPWSTRAFAVSNDGSVVVGDTRVAVGTKAFIWDATFGMRTLEDELLIHGVDLDALGWSLINANGISDDGRTIVGTGFNPSGEVEAWVAHIPAPYTLSILVVGIAACHRRRPGGLLVDPTLDETC